VVDVTDGADVYVRFGPLELRLRHLVSSWTGLSPPGGGHCFVWDLILLIVPC